jgi:hypothetical protein
MNSYLGFLIDDNLVVKRTRAFVRLSVTSGDDIVGLVTGPEGLSAQGSLLIRGFDHREDIT